MKRIITEVWTSVAVAGLLRFGINRLPFRDEIGSNGTQQRLFGRYRSIVVFDENSPVHDPERGITELDPDRLSFLRRVNDYTDCSEDVVRERFCTYNILGADGSSICGRCIQACPSGALSNSSPLPDGQYESKILKQRHRFFDDVLDFDAGNCIRDRTQKSALYADYVCARCEAICAARGVRKPA